MNHILPLAQRRRGGKVLRQCFPRDGHAVAIYHAALQEHLHHGGDAANLVQVFHHIFAAGLEVRQKGRAVADSLKVIQIQPNINRARHGDQVQHRIGGAAQHGDHDHGVLKGPAGHNVPRL